MPPKKRKLDKEGEKAQDECSASEKKSKLNEDKNENENTIHCSICICSETPCCIERTELPCCHIFHEHCLATWLSISDTCPLCKFPSTVGSMTRFAIEDLHRALTTCLREIGTENNKMKCMKRKLKFILSLTKIRDKLVKLKDKVELREYFECVAEMEKLRDDYSTPLRETPSKVEYLDCFLLDVRSARPALIQKRNNFALLKYVELILLDLADIRNGLRQLGNNDRLKEHADLILPLVTTAEDRLFQVWKNNSGS